ncbi:MAG: tyrosine--tRNA ligase [bacterium]|nr:tyrosine--tRNA ligase [bacterium]
MLRPSPDAVDRLLSHNVEQVIERAHLRARLLKPKEKLRVKLGIDPTAPDIHLGLAVVLRKLREFQELGHAVVLIIGDATARIGDPSGRSKTRPVLHHDEILANEKTYLQQVGNILDLARAEVRHNNEWFYRLSFADVVDLLQKFTVARILERDDFQKRLKARSPISLHELLYPALQAFDSKMVEADVEIGGTDQTFNLLAGRDLQPHYGQPPQDILTVPLLVGLDGKDKMSKSLGNAVGITNPPDEMFGKLMTIPDAVIPDYARLAADWSDEKVKELSKRTKKENPRDIKLEIARDIVALYYGATAAKRAADEWLRVFHKKELPEDIPTKKLRKGEWDITELLVAAGLATSKSDARRLVAQGGVQHNESRVAPQAATLDLAKDDLLQVGKRKFVRVG